MRKLRESRTNTVSHEITEKLNIINALMSDENLPSQNFPTFKTFLESFPPGSSSQVSEICTCRSFSVPTGSVNNRSITQPAKIVHCYVNCTDIQLYCSSNHCSGVRFFQCQNGEIPIKEKDSIDTFLTYVCRNCSNSQKKIAVTLRINSATDGMGYVVKLGENPSFGSPTPSRVITLIGPDREIFLKGRKAENQGLGIGAFSYYRRVVENQKARLIQELGRAAKNLGVNDEELEKFKKAAKETRFSQAIDDVKDAIPQSLLIRGNNPLSLLYKALSEGLHDKTDRECLELASSIRIVLTEMAEKIFTALKDEAELKEAISNLLNIKNS